MTGRSVLVTGATGRLGRLLVPRLAQRGHDVRALSRRPAGPAPFGSEARGVRTVTGDLRDGSGLAEALHEVDTVVHCATDTKHPQEVDVHDTRTLVEAIEGTGRPVHLVHVSIVGVDEIPLSFYRAKLTAEQAVERSRVPWTVQRATQFHPFIAEMLGGMARSPLMLLPRGMRFQPVDTGEVAARLAEHVEAGAAGRAPDFGGPEVLTLQELARAWLGVTGRRRAAVSVPLPGRMGAAYRRGANLSTGEVRGRITWAQYLAGHAGAKGTTR